MATDNQTITTLSDLLDYDIRKFTVAEIQLKTSLPEWINKASTLKLKAILQRYLDLINQHVQKLAIFIDEEKINSLSLNNQVMHAFVAEAEERFSNCTDVSIKDACLLASIQAINHFKISTYGTAAAFANALGMDKQAAFFHEAEVNEKQIDDRLSQLAEHEINNKAKAPVELHE